MARKKAQRKQGATHQTVPDRDVLLFAAAFGDLRALQAFLDAGGSPNALVDLYSSSSSLQVSLVHAIIMTTQPPYPQLAACITLLKRAGAELEAQCTDHTGVASSPGRCTAVAVACAKDSCTPLLALLQSGADANAECDSAGSKALHRAAAAGSLRHCTALISNGAHVDAVDPDGETPLHSAAQCGHASVITYLIKTAGADVNASSNKGITPLLLATHGGHAAAVAALVAGGADPAAKCKIGRNALFSAVCGGHLYLLKHFYTQHALALTVTDISGVTLLMAAARYGHVSVAEWLLQQQAAVDAVNPHTETALHHAVHRNHAAVIELLLAHGAAVDAQTELHATSFTFAIVKGHTECARALIEGGAKVVDVIKSGLTCLHIAVNTSHTEMVQLLLSGGAVTVINALGVESDDADCMTALMMCTNTAIAQLLLDAGADVHETTGTGDTCLHVAAAHKHPVPVLCLLIKAGADIHAVNDDGQTAAGVAHEYGNELAEQLLLRAARA
jgi:ankyrin repeat protein